MTEQPLLVLEHVTVGYGRHVVLPDINITLRRGAFTALVGANGTGKSTLLKTILNILPPLRGKVVLNPIDGRPAAMGYMPQRESLDGIYPLSSLEVVLMAACRRVAPARFMPASERQFAYDCLAETGATDLAPRLFSQLSGGQKQRVLMARALATRPDFLLLDEPTAGIDATATQAIMDVLRRIHEQRQLTILLVSHDLMSVRQFAREIIWLHEGKAVQGPTSGLMTKEMIGKVLSFELT